MAKGLNILTHAAQPKGQDRRSLPTCAEQGCRRKVMLLPEGRHSEHCSLHTTQDELEQYYREWKVK